jgi:hypothetical protein
MHALPDAKPPACLQVLDPPDATALGDVPERVPDIHHGGPQGILGSPGGEGGPPVFGVGVTDGAPAAPVRHLTRLGC